METPPPADARRVPPKLVHAMSWGVDAEQRVAVLRAAVQQDPRGECRTVEERRRSRPPRWGTELLSAERRSAAEVRQREEKRAKAPKAPAQAGHAKREAWA